MSETPKTRYPNSKWELLKKKAVSLRSRAESKASELFSQGDLRDYLLVLSHLPNYHVHNLLLILLQYPNATLLKGFPIWKREIFERTHASCMVLKEEWIDKGIDLIAPYTERLSQGQYGLTWYAVKQFDISQTTLNASKEPSEAYTTEDYIRAVTAAVSLNYNLSVVHTPKDNNLRSAGLAGKMDEDGILVRDDTKPPVRLFFLCECLAALHLTSGAETEGYTQAQRDMLLQYVLCALFLIWGTEPPKPLHQNKAALSEFPKDKQMDFLDLIQRSVRQLNESVQTELATGALPVLEEDDLEMDFTEFPIQ